MRSKILFTSLLLLTVVTMAVAAPVASVLKVKNVVEMKKEADFEFMGPVQIGDAIDPFDEMKTGEESYAAIIFLDDKSMVKIRENSQVVINEEGNIREIVLDKGKVLFDVNPQKVKEFKVKTPVSVASVKGTSFWVLMDEEGEKVITEEGMVNVQNNLTGESLDVPAGQMCVSTPDGAMVMQEYTPEDVPDDSMFEEEETPQEEPAEEESSEEAEEETPEETGEDSVETEDSVDTGDSFGQQVTVPSAEPLAEEAEEETGEEAGEAGGDGGFGLGMGVGAVTLDGVLYNQIAARPTFKLGKLGIGLDVVLYIDQEGNIRKDDWDNATAYLDKIYFISWGAKGDPFYAKVGGLDNVTVGNGILVNGYSNMLEYPDVKRMGVDFALQRGNVGVEGFLADWKEFRGESSSPGLLALRASYKMKLGLPMIFGVSFAGDLNPYNAFDKDRDGDGYSDLIDMYPDDEAAFDDVLDRDMDGLVDPIVGVTDATREAIARTNDKYSGIENGPVVPISFPTIYAQMENAPTIWGAAFDLTIPILNWKSLGLNVYTEEALLNYSYYTSSGDKESISSIGMAPIGVSASMFKFLNMKVEYRMAQENFVYGFFDRNYDIARVYVENEGGALKGKTRMDAVIADSLPSVAGIYGSLTASIGKIASANVAYMDMSSGEAQLRTFNASAGIQKGVVPKLSGATAYYIRNNDDDPFDFRNPSANTILGYKIAMEVSPGVDVIWNNMVTYRDLNGDGYIDPELESLKVMLIETGFNF